MLPLLLLFHIGMEEGTLGSGEVCKLSLELGNGMAVLRLSEAIWWAYHNTCITAGVKCAAHSVR
jgi:hypothetical protein